MRSADLGFAGRIENGRVQHRLVAIDVVDEAFDTAPGKANSFFLAGTLVHQADTDAVVQEGQFAQALGQDFVVKFDVAENFVDRPGSALRCRAFRYHQ